MNLDRIQASLQAIFNDDSRWPPKTRRIVFWYDPDGQFQTTFDALTLLNVTPLQLSDTPFTTKHHILIEAPEQSFLLYAPYAEPAPTDNWLLDIQKSSQTFSADRAALIFADLKLNQRSLEGVIRRHLPFFNCPQRNKALQDMPLSADSNEQALLLAMLCVLVGDLKVPDATALIRKVLIAGLLESDNAIWADIETYVSADAFWQVVGTHLGIADSKPSLRKLLTRLLVSHLGTTLKSALPPVLTAHAIRPGQQAYAFIDYWMRDQQDAAALKPFTDEIATDLKIFNTLESLAPDVLREASLFEAVDQVLIRQCIQAIQSRNTDFAYWHDLVQSRHSLFWFSQYQSIYQALKAALTLFELQQTYATGFQQSAAQLFTAYASNLHKFDRAYRDFIVASDAAQGDILKSLTKDVENLYVNEFLSQLGYDWSEALGPEWQVNDVPFHNQFFRKQVAPILNRNEREKVFVIISDAMRYEVAAELKEAIEKELRGDTSLAPQLSLLPSVTELGMAALLPGKKWQLSADKPKDITVDGLSTQGIESRAAVLQANSGVSAIAVHASDLTTKNIAQGRETVKPHRLIYIYHDVIDGRGEKPPIEREVMKACSDAIAEVLRLVKRICNGLNGTNVIITADHGFLYQRAPVDNTSKLELPKGDDIIKTNRRYLLRSKTEQDPKTLLFPLPYAEPPLNVVVPRGSIRFAKQGSGAQYVHGGASLQEVCVPIINYHHKRADKRDDGPARKVGVQVSARVRRVTNNRFRLNLIQVDPVKDRWRSRSITVALYHPETGEALTDVKQVELSSQSERPSDREFAQTLTVLVTDPPSGANLIVKDADDDSELVKESWVVNIGIINDFGDF